MVDQSPPDPAIQLINVGRMHGDSTVPHWAIRDVTVEIYYGQLTALIGPSGSGKSSLLTIAGGLDDPTTGEVWLSGHELTAASPEERILIRRAAAGYVFQEYNLVRMLTVRENVTLPLELGGASWRNARSKADVALERFGIAQLSDRFPEMLSGGEQQRVALARATVGEQRVLLADEPTGALDSRNGEAVLGHLRSLADAGCACVVATHNPEIAMAADRVVTLRDGRVVDDARRTS